MATGRTHTRHVSHGGLEGRRGMGRGGGEEEVNGDLVRSGCGENSDNAPLKVMTPH